MKKTHHKYMKINIVNNVRAGRPNKQAKDN